MRTSADTKTSTLSVRICAPSNVNQRRLLQHPLGADAGAAVAQREELLEDERDADGGDQRGEARRVAPAEGPVGDALHQERGEARGEHRHGEQDQQRPDERRGRCRGASMPRPWIAKVVAKMPRAKISEWAKLMRRSTP